MERWRASKKVKNRMGMPKTQSNRTRTKGALGYLVDYVPAGEDTIALLGVCHAQSPFIAAQEGFRLVCSGQAPHLTAAA